jgi:hypothetical protein
MRIGEITSTEWWVMRGERTLEVFASEQKAIEFAERSGGTVKKVEWKLAGRTRRGA